MSDATSPKTPGIDPGTFRLVAQCLNHYATPDLCSISLHHFLSLPYILLLYQYLTREMLWTILWRHSSILTTRPFIQYPNIPVTFVSRDQLPSDVVLTRENIRADLWLIISKPLQTESKHWRSDVVCVNKPLATSFSACSVHIFVYSSPLPT